MHRRPVLTFLVCLLLCGLAGCGVGDFDAQSDGAGVTVYLPAGETLEDFFRTDFVIVTRVSRIMDDEGRLQLVYPSLNDGASPMYSHVVQVRIPDGVPLTLDDLVRPGRMAVLRGTGEARQHELVGVVDEEAPGEGAFDWFADHPQYRRSNQ